MSASRSSYSKQDRVFQFSMEFPVPSYLVALVAGDLQHVDVGPRSVTGSCSVVCPGSSADPILHQTCFKNQHGSTERSHFPVTRIQTSFD